MVENASPFGNAASIYTTSGAAADFFQTRFRAGMIGGRDNVAMHRRRNHVVVPVCLAVACPQLVICSICVLRGRLGFVGLAGTYHSKTCPTRETLSSRPNIASNGLRPSGSDTPPPSVRERPFSFHPHEKQLNLFRNMLMKRTATEITAVGVNVGIPVPREPFAFGGLSGTLSKYGEFDVTAEGALEFFTNRRKVRRRGAGRLRVGGAGASKRIHLIVYHNDVYACVCGPGL